MHGFWIRWRSWAELPPQPMDILEIVRGSSRDEYHDDRPGGRYWSFVPRGVTHHNPVIAAAVAFARGGAVAVRWAIVVPVDERRVM